MCRLKTIIVAVVILVLAYILNPFNPVPNRSPLPKYSYDTRIKFNLQEIQSPTSHDEILSIVKTAHDAKKKIRVLGSGHSWSEIAQTEGIMISLHAYSGIISIGKNNHVTVKAGTSLSKLNDELDQKGLAMINLGSVSEQSLAGAISTATHGTGLTIGNLASLVTKVKFVSGSGKEVILSKDADPNKFQAAVVSIGMFGVLSEITIRVVPAFNLREIRTAYTLDECLANLTEHVAGHTYVKMWVEFYNNFCALYQVEKTDDKEVRNPSRLVSYLMFYSFAISTRITKLIPQLTPTMMWLVNKVGLSMSINRVDKSYLIFNDYFDLPIHQESEIIVPYSETVNLVKTITNVVKQGNHPVNYITEVRFISGDDNFLSPQFGMDNGSCAVTLTIYGREDRVHDYFDAVYDATRQFNGRIHWGKHFSRATHTDFKKWYDKYEDFVKLRKEYDPDNIFVNDFIKEKFGIKDP